MAYTTHFTRYSPVDAQWLPFWGQGASQQLLASLAFCAGLLLPLLMWPAATSTPALMACVGALAALLFQLTRMACSQLAQALVVLRLAPATASHQWMNRWRIHLWAVGLSLGGLNLAMLWWKAPSAALVLWAALVLLGAVAVAVQHAVRAPGHSLRPSYIVGVSLGWLMLPDTAEAPWMLWMMTIGCTALLAVMGFGLWRSAAHWHRWPQHTAVLRPSTTSCRARWRAWWQRWTFFAPTSTQNRLLANVGSSVGTLPAMFLLDWWPSSDAPVVWKHVFVLMWMCSILSSFVVCKDLHWRAWLAPKGMARQHLGWRVLRDTLMLSGLFMGLPALIWLGCRIVLDYPVNWATISGLVLMTLLASTLAVWAVGRRLHAPRYAGLEHLGLMLLAGAGWFAQARLGMPGHLDPLTQALPLALAVLAFALWRIGRVWQRADVYALAHRQPEPTGWETD